MPLHIIVSEPADAQNGPVFVRRTATNNLCKLMFVDNLVLCNETIDEFLKHNIVKAETIDAVQSIMDNRAKNAAIFDAIAAHSVPIQKLAAALQDSGHSFLSYYMKVEASETEPIFDIAAIYKRFPMLGRLLTRGEMKEFTQHLSAQFELAQSKTVHSNTKYNSLAADVMTKYRTNKEPMDLITEKDREIKAKELELNILSVDSEIQRQELHDKVIHLKSEVADITEKTKSVKQRLKDTERLTTTFTVSVNVFDKFLQQLSDCISNFLEDKNPRWKEVITDNNYCDPKTGKLWTLADKVLYGIKLINNYATDLMPRSYEYKPLRKDIQEAANSLGIHLDADVTDVALMIAVVAEEIGKIVAEINDNLQVQNAIEERQLQHSNILEKIKAGMIAKKKCEFDTETTRQLIVQKQRELTELTKSLKTKENFIARRGNAATQTYTKQGLSKLSAFDAQNGSLFKK